MLKTKVNHYTLTVILFLSLFIILSQPVLAFDTTQALLYEGSYSLNEQIFDHTITLKVDYVQDLWSDVYLQGDLIIRASNKKYSNPIIFFPNELYLNAYDVVENLDLKAGIITTRWGAADFFSPLDNLNPSPPSLSLTDNQDKMGVLGISATYYIDSLTSLQGAFYPIFIASPYPDEYLQDSYLAQFSPLYHMQGISIEGVELSYQPADDFVWGLQLSHAFPAFDVALSYYHGYYTDPFPANLDLALNPSGNILKLTLGYPAKQVIGLQFQGDFPGIDGATLRGDLAYIIPEKWIFQGENLLEKPYMKAVLSADYTTDSNIYLNGGFIYGLPFENGDQCSSYLYLHADKQITNTDFTPQYTFVLSLEDMSMANVIGLDYQVSENILASLSYVFVLGGTDSKLGILKLSEGIFFSLEWLF
ncbi:MAG: hypothetical protein GX240_02010 [Candidatus Atribacteria bacterium]|nr:hypothetical protein [Candidatus Atribacteria bacterium]